MAKRTFDFEKRLQQLEAIVEVGAGNSDRKSPERKAAARAQRKIKQIHAINDMLSFLTPEQVDQLSDATVEYISGLTEEYVPGVKLDIQIGDDLIQLLEEYKDVKDLYKKILKWCDSNGAQISGTEIVAKK